MSGTVQEELHIQLAPPISHHHRTQARQELPTIQFINLDLGHLVGNGVSSRPVRLYKLIPDRTQGYAWTLTIMGL